MDALFEELSRIEIPDLRDRLGKIFLSNKKAVAL
jgi:hypothetical protein